MYYDDLAIFWAKSINDGEDYLPLVQHAADVMGVITVVAEKLVPSGRREQLQEKLGDIPLTDVLKSAAWFHDSGKISLFFQPKVPALDTRVRAAGYKGTVTPKQMRERPHSIVGAAAVDEWFSKRSQKRRNRRAIRGWRYVIGGHHGVFPEFQADLLSLEPPNWQEARERFLDLGMELIGLDEDGVTKLANLRWDIADQALITGILIAADWIGSSETYFPYDDLPSEKRTRRALNRLDLGGRWTPAMVNSENFAARFGLPAHSEIRNVQHEALKMASEQNSPAFILIENETGAGKTEAALAVAEIFAEKLKLNGLFFAQPTRVTSNAMFSRVVEWLETGHAGGDPISTILAHGSAQFSEEFRSLAEEMPREVYDEDGSPQAVLEATRWFRGRKTNLLASVVVGTIDQLLFGALKSKHLVLRHLGLVGKVIIIDEIHAADDYMREYLTRILEWLGYYGVPVIALSATLPTDHYTCLANSYYRGITKFESDQVSIPQGEAYPRITAVNHEGARVSYPDPDGESKTVVVEFLDGDVEELAAAVKASADNGGCIAVICSTINRAQQVYSLLQGSDHPVELLHSRFLADHRAEKEGLLVDTLGKEGLKRPESLIVVSTQIIEQGLDLDFDLMFSDIAPVDLLVQRIGRLQRHRVLDPLRPDAMREPKLVIVGVGIPDENAPAPAIPRGITAVYRAASLLRTALVLQRHLIQSHGTITSPDDVPHLVNTAYSPSLQAPESWQGAWNKAEETDTEFRLDQIERAKIYRIPSAEDAALEKWNSSNVPDDEHRGMAQVRDADESLEVVVVTRVDGQLYALPRVVELQGIPLEGMLAMDWEIARTLARSTLRLPGWMITDSVLEELEQDGDPSWQESSWLAGQLPLVLDENLQRVLNGHLLTYEEEYGLIIKKYDQSGELDDD